jgi:hypothetical protein
LSPESRKFLVKQGHDSVVVELDLTGLDDELSVLSGRAETTPIAVQAAAEWPRSRQLAPRIPPTSSSKLKEKGHA